MNKDVFNKEHILFDTTAHSQVEAFEVIAAFAHSLGFVDNKAAYLDGLKEREAEATTGFKDHIAIPHCKHKTNLKPGMFFVRFANEIPWNSLDRKPVKVALALTIPEEGANEHLKLLSLIARKLIDDQFREAILSENDPNNLTAIIDKIDF
jgi:PTS system fructose-specific IIA component